MLFPPASPLSPLAFTGVVGAVQGIALVSVISVIIQEIIKRKQRLCGEPPSNIGDFVLIGKQGDAAFYDCPGTDVFKHDETQTCPIIYCQDDGNYSIPVFQPDPILSEGTDIRYEVVQSTSGIITSPNYTANYTSPSSIKTVWNIMVPGKNLKFKVEDINIDYITEIVFLCGFGVISWYDTYEAIGSEFTCNKPCARILLYPGPIGGRGFKISFTSDE
ncbi:hypothetical protein ACJMK2_017942 [Sinanodonta woodiana]|uniref:Uncharacterized protein n=1 Tax=Sinanodonta woodiana TaxID=1069815 RepID=A0ABD3UBW0_SINWO